LSFFVLGKAKGEPGLRMLVHENASIVFFDPNEVLANSVTAVDLSDQSLKFIVSDGSLIFFQSFPFWWIG